jgi:halocyanin-like protein
MDDVLGRRSVLTAIAGGLSVSTAGCLGSGGDTEIEADTYGDWFRGANNFEGTVDRTGQEEAQVAVGAGSGFSFDPAAVRVTTGTTIRWEWTSFGGGHNVVEENGVFESDILYDEGETFTHTFSEAGVYRYVCTPHQTQGMLGAVEVVDE